MHVAIVGPNYPDSLERNLAAAFRRLGHSVVIAGTLRPAQTSRMLSSLAPIALKSPAIARAAQRRLLTRLPRHDLDLVIVTTSSAVELWPETVVELRKRARSVVCWFVDASVHFGPARFLASPYDSLFFSDRGLAENVKRTLCLPAYFLPEGADSRTHIPSGTSPKPYVAVVGSLRAERITLLRRLKDDSIPLRIFGGKRPSWLEASERRSLEAGPWLADRAKAEIFSNAAAVLNNLHPGHIDAVNCRVFEAAGSGAVVVTESRPVLSTLFTPGVELLAYRTYDELYSRLSDALKSPDAYQGLRKNAAARVKREHTLDHRAMAMMTHLGLAAQR